MQPINGDLCSMRSHIVSKTCPFVLPAHLLNGNTVLCRYNTLGSSANVRVRECLCKAGDSRTARSLAEERPAVWYIPEQLGSRCHYHGPFTCEHQRMGSILKRACLDTPLPGESLWATSAPWWAQARKVSDGEQWRTVHSKTLSQIGLFVQNQLNLEYQCLKW